MSKPAAVLFALRFVNQGTAAVRQVQGQMRVLRHRAALLGRTLRFHRVAESWRGLKAGMQGIVQQSGMLGRAIRGALAPLAVLTSGAGAAGLYRIIHGTTALGDSLAKMAQRTGFGVERLQELEYAAKRVGVDQATFGDVMKDWTKNVGEAANGTGEAVQVFDALGVSLTDDVTGKVRPANDILEDFADALSKVEDPQTRSAIAMKVLGESGGKFVLALEKGRAGLAEYTEAARQHGLITEEQALQSSKFMDGLTDLWQSLRGIAVVITSKLLPVMGPVTAQFTQWAQQNRELIATRVGDFVRGVADAFSQLDWGRIASGFRSVIDAVVTVKNFFGSWGKAIAWIVVILHADLIIAVLKAAWAVGQLGVALAMTTARMAGLAALAVAKLVYDFFLAMKFGVGVMKALNIAMAANPIGLLVMGLAAAAGLIYTYWEPIKAFFAKFDFLSPIKKQVAALVDLLPDWVTAKLGLDASAPKVAGDAPDAADGAAAARSRRGATHPSMAMARPPQMRAAQSEVMVKIVGENLAPGTDIRTDRPRGDAKTKVTTQRVGRGLAGHPAFAG